MQCVALLLLIRAPMISTLFPYTTLFRSHFWRVEREGEAPVVHTYELDETVHGYVENGPSRSEEHTSELQSHQYSICRLLHKTKNNRYFIRNKLSSRPQ